MGSKNMIEIIVVMGLSFFFGVLFWVGDSYFEYRFFHKNLSFLLLEGPENFIESLVLKVPVHSIFVRLSFLVAALLGGSLTAMFLVNKAKSDDALKLSEEKFRNLFNNAEIAMFRTRLDGSEVLEANKKFLDLVGKKREETIGHASAILWEDQKEREKMVRRLVADGCVSELEFRMLSEKSGVRNCITSLLFCREQGILEGSIVDITERKKAEEALRKSEEKYRTILENIEDGYYEVTLTGTLTFFNDSLCQIWGYPKEELLGMHYRQYTDKENAKKLFRTFRGVFKTGNPARGIDWLIKSKNGTDKYIEASVSLLNNASDKPIGFRGIVRDITERKQAEISKTRLLLRQRAILDNLPMMAWLKDTESRLEMINEPYARACGHTIEECIGKTDLDLFPEDMAKGYMADDREVCTSGRKKQVEETISSPDGIKLHLTCKTPIYDEHGQVIGTTGIAQDITERRKAEEERVKLQNQLIQAQKMESVGQLAGGVAHDFNNMLGVILGHAEMAMDQLDPAQPLFADLEEIRKAAERSADITRQLLAFARKQTIAPKVIDLNETVEKLLKMLRRLIGEDIDLAWLPGSGLWAVRADPTQIGQILTNICVNARGAIAGIGRITVETGNSTLDDEYCVTHTDCVAGEFVRISVSDTGCGMDKLTLAHIFEPFFTTKGVGEGTGLGLSTVYGAVKQNNGFVEVASEPGQGTTFTIYLPRHVDVIPAGQKLQGSEGEPAVHGHETILLVEDEPTILKMTSTMLQLLGYTVLEAGTPGEALRLVGEFAGEIHLLLTDVVMPEMNGRDLYNNMMPLCPGLKCLFMSGYTSDIIAQQGILDLGVKFIQKPFAKNDLANKVRIVLDKN